MPGTDAALRRLCQQCLARCGKANQRNMTHRTMARLLSMSILRIKNNSAIGKAKNHCGGANAVMQSANVDVENRCGSAIRCRSAQANAKCSKYKLWANESRAKNHCDDAMQSQKNYEKSNPVEGGLKCA